MSIRHPRTQLVETMQRIYARRMTTTSGGNLSVRDESGDVWVTPARVDKGDLQPDDIVRILGDGSEVGQHPASSELPFHQAIYAARPSFRAIVHAHPTALVAFSISKQVPDARVFAEASAWCGTLGFAPYALPGSVELGERIAAQFAAGCDSVILENHGVVVGGETLAGAFARFETLEFTAQAILRAQSIGELRVLSDAELERHRQRVAPAEFDAPVPEAAERELRERLSGFVQRAYRQRLMIGTMGSFSARLGDDRFLVTPEAVDRATLGADDLVRVDHGRQQRGRVASRTCALHRALYLAHPRVGAIANGAGVNGSAFSITDRSLDSRTIPESYIVLREVGSFPFHAQLGPGDSIVESLNERSPTAVLRNDGVIAIGKNVLEAFDRLEVLESTAGALINAAALGESIPMPDADVEELRRVFLDDA